MLNRNFLTNIMKMAHSLKFELKWKLKINKKKAYSKY